jgi:hypothetical protein
MESKKLHIVLFLLWAAPPALFTSIGIFLFSSNKVNFTSNGTNIEPYIGVSLLALSAITFSVGYGCFRLHKSALYTAILYLLWAVALLVGYALQDNTVYLKYLVLPIYFTLISSFTMIFFKIKGSSKSA